MSIEVSPRAPSRPRPVPEGAARAEATCRIRLQGDGAYRVHWVSATGVHGQSKRLESWDAAVAHARVLVEECSYRLVGSR